MIYVKRLLYLIWNLISTLLMLAIFSISLVLSPVINIIVYLITGRFVGLNFLTDISDWFEDLDYKLNPNN